MRVSVVQPRPPARIMLTNVQATGKSCSRAIASLRLDIAISRGDHRELAAAFPEAVCAKARGNHRKSFERGSVKIERMITPPVWPPRAVSSTQELSRLAGGVMP